MNTRQIVLIAVLSLGAGALATYLWLPRGVIEPRPSAEKSVAQSVSVAPSGKRRILYWQDPMKPNVRFDHPGKSPYMDMELVPVYAEETRADSGVTVSAGTRQSLGIRTARVVRMAVPLQLSAPGIVAYDETSVSLVQARVSGYVDRLWVRAPQERVRRGQALADFSAPAWREAMQEYALVSRGESGPQGESLRSAARSKLSLLGIPEAVIEAIDSTHEAPKSVTLRSSIDGVVSELGIRPGAAFAVGAELFRLNGLQTVWVIAQIPAAAAVSVRVGAMTDVTTPAMPGANYRGHVLAVLPQVDAATRTVTVRVAVDNHHYRLSPGMYVSINVLTPAAAAQLWIPSEALIVTGERSVVIAEAEGGAFRVVNVTTGEEREDKTAILSGLNEGESVVISGQFLIDSEANLKSAGNRLAPSGAP